MDATRDVSRRELRQRRLTETPGRAGERPLVFSHAVASTLSPNRSPSRVASMSQPPPPHAATAPSPGSQARMPLMTVATARIDATAGRPRLVAAACEDDVANGRTLCCGLLRLRGRAAPGAESLSATSCRRRVDRSNRGAAHYRSLPPAPRLLPRGRRSQQVTMPSSARTSSASGRPESLPTDGRHAAAPTSPSSKPTIRGQLPRHWLRPLGGQGEHAWTLSRRARAQCLPQPAA